MVNVVKGLLSAFEKNNQLFAQNVNGARDLSKLIFGLCVHDNRIDTLLETLNHYLTWMPLDKIHNLLPMIARCATLQNEMGVHALDCMNEIMNKLKVPKETEMEIIFNVLINLLSKTSSDDEEYEW